VIQHSGTVNTELFGQHVHGSAAFVPLKQSLQLVRRYAPLRCSQGSSFAPGDPKDITLKDRSDPFVLIRVVCAASANLHSSGKRVLTLEPLQPRILARSRW
jgi:hypothetical protein